MWEESRFEWTWSPIPDEWADIMTLIVLALAIIFIIRHFAVKDVRRNSSFSDYLIIIIAALPFATGYSLTHGTLDSVPFLGDYMWTIHILTGEIMILMAAFLFCRTRLKEQKCTGCASCVLSCPTGTLETRETENLRLFDYSHYQCICCGSCVNTCPENAAELRHEISLKRLCQVFAKQEIRSVELESCLKCGALFVPEPLMEKIQKTFTHEYLDYCPDCRKRDRGEFIKKISPWHHKIRQYT
jgi:Pyruvate/2-oxoacid:ferredoxin oxidoreductase delta subunit